MTKLYLIIEETGSYSERNEEPRWAYRNKEHAQSVMTQLEKIEAIGVPINMSDHQELSLKETARRDAYKALMGGRAEGVNVDAHWMLCEIELIEEIRAEDFGAVGDKAA